MADRRVTRTGKDKDGDITALCNSDTGFVLSWSPRKKNEAINDIETGQHSYYVEWPEGKRTRIEVVRGPNGKYLRTDRDNTSKNNLDDLPDC